jgi:hypothetical protein
VTQADGDDEGVEPEVRPDLTSQWPADLVLRDLEDPSWQGEYLVDISTPERRQAAADHVAPPPTSPDSDPLASACAELRGRVPVVRRDVDLAVPGAPGHVVRRC